MKEYFYSIYSSLHEKKTASGFSKEFRKSLCLSLVLVHALDGSAVIFRRMLIIVTSMLRKVVYICIIR